MASIQQRAARTLRQLLAVVVLAFLCLLFFRQSLALPSILFLSCSEALDLGASVITHR